MHTPNPGNNSSDLCRVLDALEFAAAKHRKQRRKDTDASPYINHPIALARVLNVEGEIKDVDVLCAALLHDTIEDTETSAAELESRFGTKVTGIVLEVSDDKSLPKADRKALQVLHAAGLTREAKLVKLADKICNVRDITNSPPANWSLEQRLEYFDWAKRVVDGLRGVHPGLESTFDEAHEAFAPSAIRGTPPSDNPPQGAEDPSADERVVAEHSFGCSVCDNEAGLVQVLGESPKGQLVRVSFVGKYTQTNLAGDTFDQMKNAVETGDIEAIMGYAHDVASFYCPTCAVPYCRDHWTAWHVFDDDGYHDQIRGRCPVSHERMLQD